VFEVLASTATILNPQVDAAVHDLLLNALNVVLMAAVAIAGSAINNWRMSLKSGWKQTLATRLVSYAEQKIEGNEARRLYVANQLSAKFPRLQPDEIDHLLEEAVLNLKIQTTQPPPTQEVKPNEK